MYSKKYYDEQKPKSLYDIKKEHGGTQAVPYFNCKREEIEKEWGEPNFSIIDIMRKRCSVWVRDFDSCTIWAIHGKKSNDVHFEMVYKNKKSNRSYERIGNDLNECLTEFWQKFIKCKKEFAQILIDIMPTGRSKIANISLSNNIVIDEIYVFRDGSLTVGSKCKNINFDKLSTIDMKKLVKEATKKRLNDIIELLD